MAEIDRGLEKLRIWLGFFKTVVVSGVVAIIIVLLNNGLTALQLELEDRRALQALQLERLEIENGYLAQFVQEALGENLERRRRFAQYFALLTSEEAARNRWLEYLAEVEREFGRTTEALNERIAELEDALAAAHVDEQVVQNLRAQIRRLEAEVVPPTAQVTGNIVTYDRSPTQLCMFAMRMSEDEYLTFFGPDPDFARLNEFNECLKLYSELNQNSRR